MTRMTCEAGSKINSGLASPPISPPTTQGPSSHPTGHLPITPSVPVGSSKPSVANPEGPSHGVSHIGPNPIESATFSSIAADRSTGLPASSSVREMPSQVSIPRTSSTFSGVGPIKSAFSSLVAPVRSAFSSIPKGSSASAKTVGPTSSILGGGVPTSFPRSVPTSFGSARSPMPVVPGSVQSSGSPSINMPRSTVPVLPHSASNSEVGNGIPTSRIGEPSHTAKNSNAPSGLSIPGFSPSSVKQSSTSFPIHETPRPSLLLSSVALSHPGLSTSVGISGHHSLAESSLGLPSTALRSQSQLSSLAPHSTVHASVPTPNLPTSGHSSVSVPRFSGPSVNVPGGLPSLSASSLHGASHGSLPPASLSVPHQSQFSDSHSSHAASNPTASLHQPSLPGVSIHPVSSLPTSAASHPSLPLSVPVLSLPHPSRSTPSHRASVTVSTRYPRSSVPAGVSTPHSLPAFSVPHISSPFSLPGLSVPAESIKTPTVGNIPVPTSLERSRSQVSLKTSFPLATPSGATLSHPNSVPLSVPKPSIGESKSLSASHSEGSLVPTSHLVSSLGFSTIGLPTSEQLPTTLPEISLGSSIRPLSQGYPSSLPVHSLGHSSASSTHAGFPTSIAGILPPVLSSSAPAQSLGHSSASSTHVGFPTSIAGVLPPVLASSLPGLHSQVSSAVPSISPSLPIIVPNSRLSHVLSQVSSAATRSNSPSLPLSASSSGASNSYPQHSAITPSDISSIHPSIPATLHSSEASQISSILVSVRPSLPTSTLRGSGILNEPSTSAHEGLPTSSLHTPVVSSRSSQLPTVVPSTHPGLPVSSLDSSLLSNGYSQLPSFHPSSPASLPTSIVSNGPVPSQLPSIHPSLPISIHASESLVGHSNLPPVHSSSSLSIHASESLIRPSNTPSVHSSLPLSSHSLDKPVGPSQLPSVNPSLSLSMHTSGSFAGSSNIPSSHPNLPLSTQNSGASSESSHSPSNHPTLSRSIQASESQIKPSNLPSIHSSLSLPSLATSSGSYESSQLPSLHTSLPSMHGSGSTTSLSDPTSIHPSLPLSIHSLGTSIGLSHLPSIQTSLPTPHSPTSEIPHGSSPFPSSGPGLPVSSYSSRSSRLSSVVESIRSSLPLTSPQTLVSSHGPTLPSTMSSVHLSLSNSILPPKVSMSVVPALSSTKLSAVKPTSLGPIGPILPSFLSSIHVASQSVNTPSSTTPKIPLITSSSSKEPSSSPALVDPIKSTLSSVLSGAPIAHSGSPQFPTSGIQSAISSVLVSVPMSSGSVKSRLSTGVVSRSEVPQTTNSVIESVLSLVLSHNPIHSGSVGQSTISGGVTITSALSSTLNKNPSVTRSAELSTSRPSAVTPSVSSDLGAGSSIRPSIGISSLLSSISNNAPGPIQTPKSPIPTHSLESAISSPLQRASTVSTEPVPLIISSIRGSTSESLQNTVSQTLVHSAYTSILSGFNPGGPVQTLTPASPTTSALLSTIHKVSSTAQPQSDYTSALSGFNPGGPIQSLSSYLSKPSFTAGRSIESLTSSVVSRIGNKPSLTGLSQSVISTASMVSNRPSSIRSSVPGPIGSVITSIRSEPSSISSIPTRTAASVPSSIRNEPSSVHHSSVGTTSSVISSHLNEPSSIRSGIPGPIGSIVSSIQSERSTIPSIPSGTVVSIPSSIRIEPSFVSKSVPGAISSIVSSLPNEPSPSLSNTLKSIGTTPPSLSSIRSILTSQVNVPSGSAAPTSRLSVPPAPIGPIGSSTIQSGKTLGSSALTGVYNSAPTGLSTSQISPLSSSVRSIESVASSELHSTVNSALTSLPGLTHSQPSPIRSVESTTRAATPTLGFTSAPSVPVSSTTGGFMSRFSSYFGMTSQISATSVPPGLMSTGEATQSHSKTTSLPIALSSERLPGFSSVLSHITTVISGTTTVKSTAITTHISGRVGHMTSPSRSLHATPTEPNTTRSRASSIRSGNSALTAPTASLVSETSSNTVQTDLTPGFSSVATTSFASDSSNTAPSQGQTIVASTTTFKSQSNSTKISPTLAPFTSHHPSPQSSASNIPHTGKPISHLSGDTSRLPTSSTHSASTSGTEYPMGTQAPSSSLPNTHAAQSMLSSTVTNVPATQPIGPPGNPDNGGNPSPPNYGGNGHQPPEGQPLNNGGNGQQPGQQLHSGGYGQPPNNGENGQQPSHQPPNNGGYGQSPNNGGNGEQPGRQPPNDGGYGQPPHAGGNGQPPSHQPPNNGGYGQSPSNGGDSQDPGQPPEGNEGNSQEGGQWQQPSGDDGDEQEGQGPSTGWQHGQEPNQQPPDNGDGQGQSEAPDQENPYMDWPQGQESDDSKNAQPDPSSTGSQAPADGLTFAPELDSPYNFYDGSIFDPEGNSMTSENRIAQAQAINNDIPSLVQDIFNDGSINYYDPGNGEFYYAKVDGIVTQVARSCDCYVSSIDGQVHKLSTQDQSLAASYFNSNRNIPAATDYSVVEGDSLWSIAQRYGADLPLLEAANPQISNPDIIQPGDEVHVPAQGYDVVKGDSLASIAEKYQASVSQLKALNDQIENKNLIYPGQVVKVPAKSLSEPFAYTVAHGDTLSGIASRYSIDLKALEAVNPQIGNPDLIYADQVIRIPVYQPTQGQVKYTDSTNNNHKARMLVGAKFKRASPQLELATTTIQVGPTHKPIVATVMVPKRSEATRKDSGKSGSLPYFR